MELTAVRHTPEFEPKPPELDPLRAFLSNPLFPTLVIIVVIGLAAAHVRGWL